METLPSDQESEGVKSLDSGRPWPNYQLYCVTLGKSLSFSKNWFPCLQSRGSNTDPKELLWGSQGV